MVVYGVVLLPFIHPSVYPSALVCTPPFYTEGTNTSAKDTLVHPQLKVNPSAQRTEINSLFTDRRMGDRADEEAHIRGKKSLQTKVRKEQNEQ